MCWRLVSLDRCITPVNMSERMREFVEEPIAFLNEGTQFLNRCTKPNKKGTYTLFQESFNRVRVHPDLPCCWFGICHYGLDWLPCQAHSHSYQQYCAYLLASSKGNVLTHISLCTVRIYLVILYSLCMYQASNHTGVAHNVVSTAHIFLHTTYTVGEPYGHDKHV